MRKRKYIERYAFQRKNVIVYDMNDEKLDLMSNEMSRNVF